VFAVCCFGTGYFDGPITGTEELYHTLARVCVRFCVRACLCVRACVCVCLIVCDPEISRVKWLRFDFDFCATEKTEWSVCTRNIKKC
jgi:hypothetical protein